MREILSRLTIEKEGKRSIIKTKPEKDFEVIVDKDASLNYEEKKWLYFLSLPLMWVLTIWVIFKKKILKIKPKINTFLFDGLSRSCREIKKGAGSWYALDIIYNFEFGSRDGFRGRTSGFWIGMINAQAVRNRLRLVKRELIKAINECAQKEREVQLLSIASGSAQAVIEAIIEAGKEDIKIQAVFLDLDPTALDYSRKLAKKNGVEAQIKFIRGSTFNLERMINGVRPHIIEMIGFLDYRPQVRAIHLIKRIYNLLLPGGRFLTANICPNPEQYFLKWVIDWDMIYREPEGLGKIVIEGGFSPEGCRIICEPCKIHSLAICQKFV